MKKLILAIAVLTLPIAALAPSTNVSAQLPPGPPDATSTPSTSATPSTQPADLVGGNHPLLRAALRNARDLVIPDEVKEEFEHFMELHASRRFASYRKLEPGHPKAVEARNRAFLRYRQMLETERNDPPLYRMQVRAFELEDEAWGITEDMRRTRETAEKQKLMQDLERTCTEQADVSIAERAYRIEKIERDLDAQKNRLDTDQADKPRFIRQLIESALKRSAQEKPPRMPGRMGGGKQRTTTGPG